MFRAIGFLIILWGLSNYFSQSFVALDDAAAASFNALESAANVTEQQLLQRSATSS